MNSQQKPGEFGVQNLEYLRIDSSVLMKIVKHEKDGLKPNGCGQLLGNYEQGYVEATDCYPLLNNDESLSDVYTFHSRRESPTAMLMYELLKKYEKNINPILLVFDTLQAQAGALCPFRAFRLSEEWLKNIFRDENNLVCVAPTISSKLKTGETNLFVEIRINVVTNGLTRLFLLQNEREIMPEKLTEAEYKPTATVKQTSTALIDSLADLEAAIVSVQDSRKSTKEKTSLIDYYASLLRSYELVHSLERDADFNLLATNLGQSLENKAKN